MKIPCFSKVSLGLGAICMMASCTLIHSLFVATIGVLLYVLAAMDILDHNLVDTGDEPE